MKTIRVYRNPDCAKCAAYARRHERLDWLGRVQTSTATPSGHAPLRMGEVVVQDLRDGRLHEGAEAFALLARRVPAYWPMLALLIVAPLRARIDAQMRGACDGACEIPQ